MSAESLIVTKSDGSTDLTLYKASQNGNAIRFAWTGNSATERLFIDMDMVVASLGSRKSDVRNVTFRREAIEATTLELKVSKVSLQITIPSSQVGITTADINDDISGLMCLMKKAFIDDLLAGIVQTGDYNVTGPFNPVRA